MRLRIRALAALSVLLSATTLLPLLRDASWLAPVVLAVLCIAATGEGLSRLLVSGWTTIVAQLLVLVVLLTLMFVRDQAIAQILPGPDAIRALVDLSSTGFEDIRRFAIPADVTPGISMLLVGGIGFVAVWVDAAACQLRNPAPAAAGFGLLAIYAVPVAIARDGVPWPLFAAAAASWLALLATDNRSKVGRWGKVLGQTGTSTRPSAGTQLGSSASRPSSRPGDVRLSPGTVGLRVGLVAVAAAVALPTILPAFDTALLTAGAGPGRGGGDSTVTTINPIADLRRNLVLSDPRTVLTYNTTAAQPDYLRMVTLDTFDGTSWLPAKLHATLNQRVADSVLPLPPGLGSNVPTVSAEYTVQADAAFSDPRLPLPYSARRITADGDWRYDESTRNVFATDRDTRGLTYKVESITPEPVASELQTGGAVSIDLAPMLVVPDGTGAQLKPIAEQLVSGTRNPYEKALVLQNWFRTSFTYDLTVVAGNGTDALSSFLADRRGYCEQFSATMALMARTLGIPARVDVGFTAGTQQADGRWIVTTRDAHAWPELWFTGVGWIRFEPTPRVDGGVQTPPYSVGAIPPTGAVSPSSAPSAARPSSSGYPAVRPIPDQPIGGTSPITSSESASALPVGVVTLLAALMIFMLGLIPGWLRVRQRRRRLDSGTAIGAWAEIRATALDLSVPWPQEETPRRTADRLTKLVLFGDGLHRLARQVEREAYGPAVASTVVPVGAPARPLAPLRSITAVLERNSSSVAEARVAAEYGEWASELSAAEIAASVRGRLLERASFSARAASWLVPSSLLRSRRAGATPLTAGRVLGRRR